jgi:organic hydroperoxide reductase OsmC/OhrA
MSQEHAYRTLVRWQGSQAGAPFTYPSYPRAYSVSVPGKPDIQGSADPLFHGDPSRHNPEDLFVAAISACHMLTYLALCAKRGGHVTSYQDDASGTLRIDPAPGRFVEVLLRPQIGIAGGDVGLARRLHDEAHRACFIANSCRVPIRHEGAIHRVS